MLAGMPRNVEIKARISSVDSFVAKAAALADSGPTEMHQDDTFFSCPNGRLKLRTFSATEGELIFYQRADSTGPKESRYTIVPTAVPDLLREALGEAYGQVGRVRKRRILFLAGRTRIHLDSVEGLGDFLELEVVLAEDESSQEGVDIAHNLLLALGVRQHQLVSGAYVDLSPESKPPTAGHQ
jgi:predicted adenylyl cyclase CyaB